MGSFIVFILILFALAALLRVDFFFTILYLFVGVYLLSRLWSRRVFKHLKVARTLPERAFLGEQIAVTLELENLSRLPIPWLMLSESFSAILSSPPFYRKVITLGGKTTHTSHYTLHARRRGYYNIGPLMLETGDFLAINRRLTTQFEPHPLIIYPKILPMSELGLPTHSPQAILRTTVPLFQDTTRIIGIREYTPGDNPRHIHWPATAATGRMSVKQFQTAIARDNCIFLNLERNDYGRPGQAGVAVELAIVTAASLAHHMIINEGLPVGLTTIATDPLTDSRQTFRLPPDKGQSHLMQILELLARVESTEDIDFAHSLQQETVHLSWGATVIIITSIETEALLQMLLLLRRSGFHVTLILVQPAAYVYPTAYRVQELGIPVFKIRGEKDIETWLFAV
jgi:uncharacterized protein (DUF58 family)